MLFLWLAIVFAVFPQLSSKHIGKIILIGDFSKSHIPLSNKWYFSQMFTSKQRGKWQ
jgi:hypothetical protein